MIKFLKRNQQFFIFFIFIYAVISVFGIYIFHPIARIEASSVRDLPLLMGSLSHLVINGNVYLPVLIFIFLIVLIVGFYLVRINIKFLIIPNRTQFAVLFYLSIVAFSYKYAMFSEAAIGALFILFVIERLFGSIQQKELSYRYIDAGILLSIGSIFYFNLIFLIPFLFLSQLTLRASHRKELLLILVGIILPYTYLFAYYYLIGKSFSELFSELGNWLGHKGKIEYDWLFISSIGVYILMIFIASIFAIRKFTTTKIQVRKLYQLFFYLFFNVIAIYFIVPSAGHELFFLVAIPLSALLSVYFAECRNTIFNNIIFLLLIAVPLLIYFIQI